MPAPTWTWVDVVGPPVAPYTPPFSDGSNTYKVRIDIDLSSYVGYYQDSGATPTAYSSSGGAKKIQLGHVHACDRPEAIYSLASSQQESKTSWQIKAITGYVDIGEVMRATEVIFPNAPSLTYNMYQRKLDVRFVNASPVYDFPIFCLEIPAGIRSQMSAYFTTTIERTPTHFVFERSGVTLFCWQAKFDSTTDQSNLVHMRSLPYPRNKASEVLYNDLPAPFNPGTVNSPMAILPYKQFSRPSHYIFGGSCIVIPILDSLGNAYAITDGSTDGFLLAHSNKIDVGPYTQPYQVATGAAAPSAPYTVIDYLDITGAYISSETVTGSWYFGYTSGPWDYYFANDMVATLSPPANAIYFCTAPSGNPYANYFRYRGSFTNTMLLSNFPIPTLDGAGTMLPGYFFRI